MPGEQRLGDGSCSGWKITIDARDAGRGAAGGPGRAATASPTARAAGGGAVRPAGRARRRRRPAPRSRSSAWSRRMKDSSGAREQQHADGPRVAGARPLGTRGDAAQRKGVLRIAVPNRRRGRSSRRPLASPPGMTSYLRRLLRTGAAYQLADAVSKVVALALLPLYTRHLTPADYGTAELLLTTIILGSIVLRLGLGEALVRFHFLDADTVRRAPAGAHRAPARCSSPRPSRRAPRRSSPARSAPRCSATRSPASSAPPRSGSGRSRTSSSPTRSARRGAGERRRHRLAANVALTVLLTLCLVVARDQGRARPAARQLRRLRRSSSACGGAARRLRAPAGRDRQSAARPDASLRPADRPRRGLRLRAVLRRPVLALPLRAPGQAGLYSLPSSSRDRRRSRARVPVRVAAARLLDRRRRRGPRVYARVTTLLRPLHRHRRRRPRAARPLARAPARRPGLLRGPRGPALGRARLGALRPLPGARGDGRPRAGHRPQRARRARRPGRERRAARAARPAARDRRRGPRALRRLRRDADGDVGADPQPVPGRVRVGEADVLRARRGRDRRRGRAAAAGPPASTGFITRALALAAIGTRPPSSPASSARAS